jgi:hypothetical protein
MCLLLLFPMIFQAWGQNSREVKNDAEFQKIMKEYSLNDNGEVDFHCIKQIKLLTYNSFHRLYGETFIIYNPVYQKLKINECYTVMADGKKVVTPPNAFNEVLPRYAANAPVFNHLKEMVITHTALEIGATLYLDYTLTSKSGFYPYLMGQEDIYESNPVLSYDFTIRVPEGIPLNYRLYHLSGEPAISMDGKNRSFSWHFSNIRPFLTETLQPDFSKFAPTLVFSCAKDLFQATKGILDQAAFKSGCTDEMNTYAETVFSKDSKVEIKNILSLQDKVINDFNLYAVPLNIIGYRVRTPEEVWKSAGGTEIEKCLLFIALLNSRGIQADLIARMPGYYDKGMGNLAGMDHFFVRVSLKNDSPVFLSVTEKNDQNLIFRKAGWLMPLQQGISPEPIQPRLLQNIVRLSGKMDLDEDNELEGRLNLHLEGMLNPYFLLNQKPSAGLSGITGFKSTDFTGTKISFLKQESSESVGRIEKHGFFKQEGDYCFITWPVSEAGIKSWHMGELVLDRKNPLEIPYPVTESYTYEIKLPEHWQCIFPAEKIEMNNTAGRILSECRQEKNTLRWFAELQMFPSPDGQQSSDYYLQFKEIIARWSTLQSQGCIVKTSP